MENKSLHNTDINGAKKNVKDIQVFGNGDLFTLISKASSENEGWMKSTKAMFVGTGCLVQVTTQQRNPDGSYAVAEALTYVPGVAWYDHADGYRFLGPIIPSHNLFFERSSKMKEDAFTGFAHHHKMSEAGFKIEEQPTVGLTAAEAEINFYKNHAKHFLLKSYAEETRSPEEGTMEEFMVKAKAYLAEDKPKDNSFTENGVKFVKE